MLIILESTENASIDCEMNQSDNHQLQPANGHKPLLFIRLRNRMTTHLNEHSTRECGQAFDEEQKSKTSKEADRRCS